MTLPLSAAAARRAGFGQLRHVAVTGSTNDDLADEARRGLTDPAVLVADHQTAGRGRRSRHWIDAGDAIAPDASLLVSFRLRAERAGGIHHQAAAVSAAALSAVPVAAGASVAAGAPVAAGASHHATVWSKWPNDLLLEWPEGSGKLAGVLAEMIDGAEPSVVVGLGLNIAAAPSLPDAASLAEAKVHITRDELLAGLIEALPRYVSDPARARAELLAASATIGCQVRVRRVDGTSIVGTARSVDAVGRLLLDVDGVEHVVDAGDVHHLRPG